jgi:BRCA1-associated protein
MPSYFYHLAIELFSRPQSDLNSFTRDSSLTTSLSFESACEALLPFQKRPSSSFSRSSLNQIHKKSRCASPDSTSESCNHPAASTSSSSPAPRYTRSPACAFTLENDLRLDKISVECIDMIPSSRNNPVTTGIGTEILGGLRTKGLYRDANETPFLGTDEYPAELKGSSAAARRSYADTEIRGGSGNGKARASGSNAGSELASQAEYDCTTLCILAVPSYMSASDLLGFVGEATMDDVSHFRMIRTARANRYMVLMKFRSGKKAREWQKEWNGKVFNSMEVCSASLIC